MAAAEGQNTEGTGRATMGRASERYHLSGKQSGKSDRVLDIDTALPLPSSQSQLRLLLGRGEGHLWGIC